MLETVRNQLCFILERNDGILYFRYHLSQRRKVIGVPCSNDEAMPTYYPDSATMRCSEQQIQATDVITRDQARCRHFRDSTGQCDRKLSPDVLWRRI